MIPFLSVGIGFIVPCVLGQNLTVVEESAADTIPDLDADGNQELAIPLSDVLSGNISQYSGDTLYAKYENWTKASDGAAALLNDPSLAANATYLTSINCYSNSPDCYFTFTMPGVPDPFANKDDAGDDTAVVDERALVEPRKKNAQANHRNVWLHMNTRHNGQAHEHHFHYNLKCGTLQYRSTAWSEVTWNLNRDGNNKIKTHVVARRFGSEPHLTATFRFFFQCRATNGNCCVQRASSLLTVPGQGAESLTHHVVCVKGKQAPLPDCT